MSSLFPFYANIGSLPAIPYQLSLALMAIYGITLAEETFYLGICLVQRSRGKNAASLVFEGFVLFFLLLCTALSWSLTHRYVYPLFGAGIAWINLFPVMFACIVGAVFGLVLACRQKSLVLALESASFLVVTPFTFNPASKAWCLAFTVLALLALCYKSYALLETKRTQSDHLSVFATISAINLLPEGVMCFDRDGVIELMNESMRDTLAQLHLPADLADGRKTLDHVRQLSARDESAEENAWHITLPNGTTRLFASDSILLQQHPHTLLVAYDTTKEEQLITQLSQTTAALQKTQDELRKSLEDVKAVAENDALLYLHSRVHDIIGARLSILHRYLEDDTQSEASFDAIRPLLDDILEDLENDENNDSRTDLFAICYAFSLIDVHINIEGALPEDERTAAAFVQLIREGSTNAVKHAQASEVSITMEKTASAYVLTISNNGAPFHGELRQGTGLPGMARAIIELNGSLTLQTEGAFTLCATVPLPASKEDMQ